MRRPEVGVISVALCTDSGMLNSPFLQRIRADFSDVDLCALAVCDTWDSDSDENPPKTASPVDSTARPDSLEAELEAVSQACP